MKIYNWIDYFKIDFIINNIISQRPVTLSSRIFVRFIFKFL